MGRKKGSLNKKILPAKLNFDSNINFEEKTEICMDSPKNEENNDIAYGVTECFGILKDSTEKELEQLNQELDIARIELEKTRLEVIAKKQELTSLPIKVAESPAIAIKDESLKAKIDAQKERDSVMVTGKFHNLRVKGQSVKLPYLKHGHEPVKWWPFDHGKIYTIPKGFADQINGGSETDPCYYTPRFIKNEGIILNPDEPESGIHDVDTSDKKYAFVPLNF